MFIRTRIASASMFLEARVPTDKHPVPTQHTLSFELLPTDERDHLDLDTGEVFQDFGYARLHKNEQKLIGASITVRPAADDSHYRYNSMRYVSAHKSDEFGDTPSSIHFDAFIAPSAFKELEDNIRNNLLPSTITIELFHDLYDKGSPIQYGWEPDGSGTIWHNQEQKNQKIPVTSIRFDYSVVKPRHDEHHIDRLLPSESAAPTDRMNNQIDMLQSKLIEMLKYLRWTAVAISVIAVVILIVIARQGRIF